ncbi:MAG TPA: hypothetical protein VHL58_17815 [Thermoanaerobaculia bacterium]|nr:hypothetical protein [Thermoanaerobaculia bacterium]
MTMLRTALTVALLLFFSAAGRAETSPIQVKLTDRFFSPSLGAQTHITVTCVRSGTLTAHILDRDGFPTRTLATKRAVRAGKTLLSWDGKDEAGVIVPDEAYSLWIELKHGKQTSIYFPANALQEHFDLKAASFDRRTGVVSYILQKPSRMHIQAGAILENPITHEKEGPVLKTIVNREPRLAGAVIEQWNGKDESNSINVSDRPGFVLSVAATALPENAIFTANNRVLSFLEYASKRTGASMLTVHATSHAHHAGLSALEDHSPELVIEAENATPGKDAVWLAENPLRLKAHVNGLAAPAFLQEATKIYVFVDDRLTQTLPSTPDARITVPVQDLPDGEHTVALNWISPSGAVAVNALRFMAKGHDGGMHAQR